MKQPYLKTTAAKTGAGKESPSSQSQTEMFSEDQDFP